MATSERAGEVPEVEYGGLIGYVVTLYEDGRWNDSWDGEIHPTFEEGQKAIRECSAAGYFCLLAEVKRVEVNRPCTRTGDSGGVLVQASNLHKNVGDAPSAAPCEASRLGHQPGLGGLVEIREERQQNPVAEQVGALVAVTRPILAGVLQSISVEMLTAASHDRNSLPLKLLGRLRKQGDGDCGIAFEYAVHDAILSGEAVATERVTDALKLCRIDRGSPASILFAIEKQGSQQLILTDMDLITPNSRMLSGKAGQPVKLQNYLNMLAAAFRRPATRLNLPQSIRGLWKADLFLGSPEPDHWVGTSVKINPDHLQAAPGLRIAIVPSFAGRSDAIRLDEQKRLVVCPMPHDGSFMQVFYEGWRIAQALCDTDFRMPREVQLPSPIHREVARVYIERREFPVLDVLEAVQSFAQPELLVTRDEQVTSLAFDTDTEPDTSTVVSPFAGPG